jgi:AcrR family transcriptional regulator
VIVPHRKSNWIDYMREHLGDLAGLLPRDFSTRLKDSTIEALINNYKPIMKAFVGDGEPKTAKERKKRRILEAATELFISQGYRKTSIDEVARRAAVAKGTVYLYFKNKNDLLFHAIALEKSRYVGDAMAILAGDLPPLEKLRAYLGNVFVLGSTMPLISRLMGGDRELLVAMEEMGGWESQSAVDMQGSFFAYLLRRSVPKGSLSPEQIDQRAQVFTGLMYSASSLMDDRLHPHTSAEQFAATLADILIDGVGNQPGGTRK